MSWVPIPEGSEFGVDNLPYGVFSAARQAPRVGVAVGDHVLDLAALGRAGLLDHAELFETATLNPFLAAGRRVWEQTRTRLQELLSGPAPADAGDLLVAAADATLHLPVALGDYVDFYSSLEHASNLGRIMRPGSEPLLPNWRHMPVGYHGRAGTVVCSGTPIRRPTGQRKPPDASAPTYGPSTMLDIELEVGFVTGPGNPLGEPIPTRDAAEHIFGLVLVNDWSARDIQAWEYQPLGPFLGKSFATTVSPWVVPLGALERFRVPGPVQEPPVLDYLRFDGDWNVAIELEVGLASAEMLTYGHEPAVISRTSFADMYWNMAQQLAHLTANGATIRPGDLCASGTVSGPTPDSRGSLIELTWRGAEPLKLPDGSTRAFLEDGDLVVIRGWCGGGDGRPRIGFGECRGAILPALPPV
jgi:fumarylacetoacetase